MYRERLRPMPSAAELATMYATPHDHRRWADHILRVDVSAQIGAWLLHGVNEPRIADLSCGNAELAKRIRGALMTQRPVGVTWVPMPDLGDLAHGYPYCGPIERTIEQFDDDHIDLFICSETIEHLDDPDAVVARIAAKAHRLLLSTPIGETVEAGNPEHTWGWDTAAVCAMLAAAGWRPTVVNELRFADYEYDFMILGCERA